MASVTIAMQVGVAPMATVSRAKPSSMAYRGAPRARVRH